MAENKEILSLKDAKDYLRVGYDEDDAQIQDFIEAAEAYIDGCVGTGYKKRKNYDSYEDYKKGRNLAALLQKKIIGDMYDRRTTTISVNTKTDTITKTILDKLANVGN